MGLLSWLRGEKDHSKNGKAEVVQKIEPLRVSERMTIHETAKFTLNEEIVEGVTLDVSGTGLQMETDQPLVVCLHVEGLTTIQGRRAHLVWARQTEDGRMRYGLAFEDKPIGSAFRTDS